ncbi:isochorismatase family protein [Amycolatopsis jejuensis]|uniref:isochorismatase family protein n=1 Tax=Amycolatopsis jejuensis TaxID=330084 RepID=UPI0005274AB6|nr:isochorismatase family protein [Amycolatopsis jejuensis]
MTFSTLVPEDTAVLLIDHQDGTMSWVGSIDQNVMKANAVALARVADALKMPLVLTSSLEDHAQGPLAKEFEEHVPEDYAKRIKRIGVVNAWDDPAFAAAVEATGKRTLVIAGVTNDVCTVYPTITALERGYAVHVVADAGGSPNKIADDAALRLMENAGAHIVSTNMVLTGLARDWSTPAGQAVLPVAASLIPA